MLLWKVVAHSVTTFIILIFLFSEVHMQRSLFFIRLSIESDLLTWNEISYLSFGDFFILWYTGSGRASTYG
ncbi:MAG: hypothetical protein Crog4KO_34530 [Crocinitomicaceae bacterium]